MGCPPVFWITFSIKTSQIVTIFKIIFIPEILRHWDMELKLFHVSSEFKGDLVHFPALGSNFSLKKNFCIFSLKKTYISSEKLLIIQEGTFQVRKIKKPLWKNYLYFWKLTFLFTSLKISYIFLKIFLYFRRKLAKPQKQKKSSLKTFLIFLQKKFFLTFRMTTDQVVK